MESRALQNGERDGMLPQHRVDLIHNSSDLANARAVGEFRSKARVWSEMPFLFATRQFLLAVSAASCVHLEGKIYVCVVVHRSKAHRIV